MLNVTATRLPVRATRPSLCASRRISSSTVLAAPAASRWKAPTVQQAPEAQPTPQSDAIAHQIIEAFKRTTYGRAYLNHPDKETAAQKVFQFFYAEKMPRDFFHDSCHNGPVLLAANKPTAEIARTAESYYDAYGYNRLYIPTGSGR
jgi:hypothetical protein